MLIGSALAIFAGAQLLPSSTFFATSGNSASKSEGLRLKRKMSISSKILANGIDSAAFSPTGDYVAIGSMNSRHIVVWDLKNNREHLQFDTLGTGMNANAVSWSPDGRYITDGRRKLPEGVLRLWDPMSGKVAREFAFAVDGQTEPARFNRDGTKMLLRMHPRGFDDFDFTIFDLRTGERKDFVSGISLHAADWIGEKIALFGGWPSARDGQVLDGIVHRGGELNLRIMDISGSEGSQSIVIDGPRFNPKPSFPDRGYTGVYEIAVDPTERQVAVGLFSKDLEFRVVTVNLSPLQLQAQISLGHTKPNGLFYFRDGEKFGVIHFGAEGTVYQSASGTPIMRIPGLAALGGVAVSRDGRLLSIGMSGELLIYEVIKN